METFARGSSCGLRSSSRSSGTSRADAVKSASCSRTSARRPCSFARLEQRPRVHALRDGH